MSQNDYNYIDIKIKTRKIQMVQKDVSFLNYCFLLRNYCEINITKRIK